MISYHVALKLIGILVSVPSCMVNSFRSWANAHFTFYTHDTDSADQYDIALESKSVHLLEFKVE